MISAAAWVLAAGFSGKPGLYTLLMPAEGSRTSPAWYGLALLGFPLFLLAGLGLSRLSGQSILLTSPPNEAPSLLLQVVTLFLYILLFGGPLNSESGWRGFALPHLQKRFSPLIASLVLGVAWAVWRFPLFINGFYSSGSGAWLPVFAEQALNNLLLAFLFTWLFNHTRGNVLVCVLLHASVLTASSFIAASPATTALFIIAAAACILESKMWKRT